MSNKIQIVLNGQVNRADIIAALTDDSSYEVDVLDNYVAPGTSYVLDINDLDSDNKEAFYKTLDNANHLFEADALIWKVKRDGKAFNLNSSYVRDAVSTAGTLTKIPDGTPLKARFEVPGFESSTVVEIDLWIAEAFNPTDLTALEAIGIEVTGDGGYFEITNTIECKVSFSKPSAATELYIIDDVESNTVIAV
jgi:hypothetical protein